MKKEKKESGCGCGLIAILLVICLFVFFIFDDEEEKPVENSSDKTYTLMVYMCGSDLESEDGAATSDLEEMKKATIANELKVIIFAGGTKDWKTSGLKDKKNQIIQVENGEIKVIENNVSKNYMSHPDTLTYFIDYVFKNYKSDRYGLIMWDHGGGAISGFGYDENNPNEEDTLSLSEMKTVFSKYKNKFEFIGFDACLMSNFETAYVLKDSAKYLIASEETEPGTGWDYTAILNQLSKDTSQDTVELGKKIVDSFIKDNDTFFGDDATLTIIDLSKINKVYEKYEEFLKELKKEKFNSKGYRTVSKTLNKTKAFAEGDIDTIDLIDFAKNMQLKSSNKLIDAVNDSVVYHKTIGYLENANGLSIYFPNEELEYYDNMYKLYKKIGFSNTYINIINEYANILYGGYKGSYRVNKKTYKRDLNLKKSDWYDKEIQEDSSKIYKESKLSEEDLKIKEKNGKYYIHLSDEKWDNVADLGLSLWYDTGKGYIDLGLDTNYEIDDDNNLIVDFDNTWVCINGYIVNYEVFERSETYEKGRIPALLNGEEVNLIVISDEKHPSGYVVGAQPVDSYGDTSLYSKGYTKIKEGDKIEFIADFYKYNGDYEESYVISDKITVDKDGLQVGYTDIDEGKYYLYYVFTDVFNNIYYTDSMEVNY